jgi:PncC family amidohydrolase
MEKHVLELAREIGSMLSGNGWRLATAESCSGGLIGHMLTEIAGSSAYYQGGLIAYDNDVKSELLGVSPATLVAFGAVSEACALEMAHGARRLLHTDVAVATTGIAGPGGGSAEKPVGLVYVAIVTPHVERGAHYLFNGDRTKNKELTARRALEMLRDALAEATG